jgi:sugar phosphate isomerase/epimerase
MDNPIVISTAAYDGYDLAVAFKEISEAGIDLVEIAFIEGYMDPFNEGYFNGENAEKILSLLAEHGLNCLSFSCHMDLSKQGVVDILENRMTFAKNVGSKYIISNAAPIQNRDRFLKNIRKLGRLAQQMGLMIALENPGDGKPNVMDSGKPAARMIEEIGLDSVRINYDFGNLLSHCFEKIRPEQDYLLVRDVTAHYHIKDVASDDTGWYFTPIGRGTIDYKSILRQLADFPTSAPLSLEIPLRIRRAVDASPRRAVSPVDLREIRQVLRESVAYVKRCLAE